MTPKQKKKFDKFLNKIRNAIPDNYNKLELFEHLSDETIDLLVSITSRGDGKSYNMLKAYIALAVEFDIRTLLLASHFTLRNSYMGFVEKILIEDTKLGLTEQKMAFRRNDDFITILYDKKPILYISDLNNASDLKYYADTLQEVSIIFYDEFLKLDSDYMLDEDEKLKIIYQTVDRGKENEYIPKCKIVLAGNPVNFNSPLLSRLNLFKCLEKQSINTIHRYDNIVLEKRRNDQVNEEKNLRLFNEVEDNMVTGEFVFNDYLLCSDKDLFTYNQQMTVKLKNIYLNIRFNEKHDVVIGFSNIPLVKDYKFCTSLEDLKRGVTLLTEKKFFKERFVKYYDRELIKFENAFSISYIEQNKDLKELHLFKLILSQFEGTKEKELLLKEADDIPYDEMRAIKIKLAKEYNLIY